MTDEPGNFPEIRPRESIEHLLVAADGMCWWCRASPATTGEHKYKASDLGRMMDGDTLVWFDDVGGMRHLNGRAAIQRDRHGVVKFAKSLCAPCNNARSQPFDLAYQKFSNYIDAHPEMHQQEGVDFTAVFGTPWRDQLLNLARYYVKHFGCQMVQQGIAIPDSLRAFLDGSEDMPDVHMGLVTTRLSQTPPITEGLHISAGIVWTDQDFTEVRGCVFAVYIGAIGVRFWWQDGGIPEDRRSQFFHYPCPILNRFTDDQAVAHGIPND